MACERSANGETVEIGRRAPEGEEHPLHVGKLHQADGRVRFTGSLSRHNPHSDIRSHEYRRD